MLCAVRQFTHRGAVHTGAFTVTREADIVLSPAMHDCLKQVPGACGLFELMLLMVDTGQD